MKFGIGVFLFVFCLNIVSAGFVEDVLGGEDFKCEDGKRIFEENYLSDDNYRDSEIPSGIPFSDDVFDVYIDEEFFGSVELVERKVVGVECEVSEDVSYNVYVSSDLIDEVASGGIEGSVADFYNKKKGSGELRIEAVGFGRKLKLGFVNFGLRIAGWFS